MHHRWTYPYVSHLMMLAPEVAEVRFDLACLDLAAAGPHCPSRGRPVLAVPSGRLVLGSPARPARELRGYLPARTLAATLHPGRWGAAAIDVTVELLPWSATRSELALIAGPAGRWPVVGERRYLRLAHDVLRRLVAVLHAVGAEDHRPRPVSTDVKVRPPVDRAWEALQHLPSR